MKHEYSEFIYYNNVFEEGKNYLFGENSPLDEKGIKDFFSAYLRYGKERYGEDFLFQKAVSESEIKKTVKQVKSKKDVLRFTAYAKDTLCDYRNWTLYTSRARIKGKTVCFFDDFTFPVPNAKYEFTQSKPKEIVLRICFDERYRAKITGGLSPTTPGRHVELRCGYLDVIKIFFSADGQIVYKDGSERKYHHALKKIGDFEFSKPVELKIILEDTYCKIYYQNQEYIFPYTNNLQADALFINGGMQPSGDWSVEVVSCIDKNGEQINLFEKEHRIATEEKIGEVELPFVLGTHTYKDKTLVLKSKIQCVKDGRYALQIDALDPCGEVWINGTLAQKTDTFQPFQIDITEFVQEGENSIELRIFPRAPENLYPWHKHNDLYVGWFCLGVALLTNQLLIQEPIIVTTQKIEEKTEFKVCWNTGLSENLRYTVSIRESFPKRGEWKKLEESILEQGKISRIYKEEVALWTMEKPVLYDIRIQLKRGNKVVYATQTETGFRIIEQKTGEIYLNGERIVLRGALNMQFLPPYEKIAVNHVCPSWEKLVEQILAVKNMNGNAIRMHQLGYGTADTRWTRVCNRLGIAVFWTTRLIDAVENVCWDSDWKQAKEYQRQMKQVINSPSVFVWEGSNELHADLKYLDNVYDAFVQTVKEIDTTRLLSPVSHLYYGGGIYDGTDCEYYNTAGTHDFNGLERQSSFGWKDSAVVRSSHPYSLFLGYGQPWKCMVEQDWRMQGELLRDKEKAYLVTEFAITGRQNPETAEAKLFNNTDGYEYGYEQTALGFIFKDEEWELSQAYQAYCTDAAIKRLWSLDVDGMFWCSLWGGANNGSYLKPIIDFQGYRKMAYYQMAQGYQKLVAFNEKSDALWGQGYEVSPLVCGLKKNEKYSLTVEIFNESKERVAFKEYGTFLAKSDRRRLEGWYPSLQKNGYYVVKFTLQQA